MIDYRSLIDGLRIDKVIELFYSLGAQGVENRPECLITNTICHNADPSQASMKLYYYKNSHQFYCYTECGSMSIFSFLRHYYETRGTSYDWYSDILAKVLICSTGGDLSIEGFSSQLPYQSERERYELRKQRKDLQTYPNGIIETFQTFYPPEWAREGISYASMQKANIRFSPLDNKIIIPHYDVNNNLVGIRGRALDPWVVENVGKYMPVQIENTWYSHPLALNLYGLNWTKENIKRYGICYVCEAEKAVLQCESFSFPNCAVGVCGSSFNKFQLDLLMRHCQPKEVIICFDKEEMPNEDRYFQKLYKIAARYSNYTNMSFVYDRANLLDLKQSPTDRGETVFKKLIESRVKIY